MPSQATNYFYTMVAMGAIALMIANAFDLHSSSLQAISERQELKEFLETVASEATELAALAEATNATTKISMQAPQMIGNKLYWMRMVSDSSGAWVEGGFGDPWTGSPDFRVDLPGDVSASGTYKGGYGTLSLNCTVQGADPVLVLGRWEGG
jgi:hypothetical protein